MFLSLSPAAWAFNGAVDGSFGVMAQVNVGDSTPNDVGRALAAAPDGTIWSSGQGTDNGTAFIRFVQSFNSNGSYDTSFGIAMGSRGCRFTPSLATTSKSATS